MQTVHGPAPGAADSARRALMGSAFGLPFGLGGAATGAGECPCGGSTYDSCCGPLHRGEAIAQTAEQLMRSRYSAFARGEGDYLLRTWHPRTRPEELRLDPQHVWTGLEMLSTRDGGPQDAQGEVSYRASSRSRDGRSGTLTEVARFERRGRRWVYVDGEVR